MLQISQESAPKQVATTKIWYCRAAKVVGTQHQQNCKALLVRKPEQCKCKEFVNRYDKAFYAYWQSIHSMLKAVACDVNCTSDAYKASFNVILNFMDTIDKIKVH